MERTKRIAVAFFRNQLGYSVTEIPEATDKRADLDVHDGEHRYIVEVKEKLDNWSPPGGASAVDQHSPRPIRRQPFSRSNRLDGVLKHGGKQLSETPCGPEAFTVLWLFTEGPNADMMVRRALFTFYGIQIVTRIDRSGASANCVYFDYSTAHAMPHVNGLIVSQNGSLQLCLNEFSPNYRQFRQADLVQQFGEAIYDPSRFDQKEGTIVLRSNISRKNQNDVLNELERTTGIRYTIIEMNRYTF